MAKNNPWPVTGLGNKGPLKVLNGTKLILDNHRKNLESFIINLESFSSIRGPLHLKPVTGQELFFAVSYSKPALKQCCSLLLGYQTASTLEYEFTISISWNCKCMEIRVPHSTNYFNPLFVCHDWNDAMICKWCVKRLQLKMQKWGLQITTMFRMW